MQSFATADAQTLDAFPNIQNLHHHHLKWVKTTWEKITNDDS